MSNLTIKKKNEVYLKIQAEPHINYELADYFTFEVPQAKFMQRNNRYKKWDGKIRLYSPGTGEIYVGLVDYLTDWCVEKGYSFNYEDCEYFGHPREENQLITPEGVVGFVKALNLPVKARDY